MLGQAIWLELWREYVVQGGISPTYHLESPHPHEFYTVFSLFLTPKCGPTIEFEVRGAYSNFVMLKRFSFAFQQSPFSQV